MNCREKVLSPAVGSPLVPSSNSVALGPRPAQLRLHVTERPVLGGLAPGVTVALMVTSVPWLGLSGAVPTLSVGEVCAVPHALSGDALLRGAGVPVLKSVLLLSVSVQPPFTRSAADVLVRPAVGLVSEQFAVEPYPMTSTTPAVGQARVTAVVELERTFFPAVADIAIVPVASGVGRSTDPPAPCASW